MATVCDDATIMVGVMPAVARDMSTSTPATELSAIDALENMTPMASASGYVDVRVSVGKKTSAGLMRSFRGKAELRAAMAATIFCR